MVGLAILLASGHFVVTGASTIGRHFGLSAMVVGLTIVAAGTSAPELAVVFQAIAADDTELAVGSVIGSNIANVLLVLGLVAAFGAVRVTSRVVRIDIPIMITASVTFLLLALDGRLGRLDGLILLSGLVIFVVWTLASATKTATPVDDKSGPARSSSLVPAILGLVVGVGGLAIAARLVVGGAEQIAVSLGVPELIVGLTVVALGTSAPEIVTTVIAAVQGRRDLAVGNAVGSNIFNVLLVLGGPTLLTGGLEIGSDAVQLDIPIMVAAAVACLPIVFWDHTLDRWEGVMFVFYYVAYLIFLVLDSSGHGATGAFVFVLWFFVVPLTAVTVVVAIVKQRRVGAPDTTTVSR